MVKKLKLSKKSKGSQKRRREEEDTKKVEEEERPVTPEEGMELASEAMETVQNSKKTRLSEEAKSEEAVLALNEEEKEEAISSLHGDSFFSAHTFSSLPLLSSTKQALSNMGFDRMTNVQYASLAPMLAGKDIVASAKTGSGKTLAFLVPIVDILTRLHFSNTHGVGAIIVAPTRELCLQIKQVLDELCHQMRRLLNRKNQQNEEQIRFFDITASLIIGGVSKSTQARFLREKNSILVCTPGRMLDHLVNTEFNFSNLQFLVFDECDRLLSQGFEDEINQLLNILGVRSESASKRKRKNKKKGGEGRGGEGDEEEGNKKKIQTILFSATVDDKVLQLIDERLSKEREEVLLNSRLRSAAEEEEEESEGMDDATTVSNLNQGYICVEPDLKLASLYMLLKKYHKRNKIMVFFSSCNAVKFHSDILNYLNIPCFNIFGKLKQSQRTNTFLQFSQAEQGVLLCTNIGSRGWDIPHVNIVIQYDPPEEVDEYIHRVGRTCRGESSSSSSSSQQQQQQHRSILFLLPNELPFVEYLAEAHHVHSLQAYQLANSDQGMGGKLRALATQCQQLIAQNYYLYNSAKQAYKSYVLAYKSYKYKRDGKGNLLFNVFDLDLQKIAFAYGFQVPPKVNLNLSMRGHKKARGKQQQQHGTGNNHYEISSQPFSASNPKGRREASDKRQFSK